MRIYMKQDGALILFLCVHSIWKHTYFTNGKDPFSNGYFLSIMYTHRTDFLIRISSKLYCETIFFGRGIVSSAHMYDEGSVAALFFTPTSAKPRWEPQRGGHITPHHTCV